MIRKIIGLGKYSAIVSIPKELMKSLGWRKSDDLPGKASGLHPKEQEPALCGTGP